ncbi:MAG: nucleoside kinase [Oscillospiraceae bacterium]|nr:nucleoside kinase [Oscillospiraceae bacterium]
MNILSLYDLNSNVASNSGQFICGAEELYRSRIQTVAEHLSENCEEMPIILISGPSGSGKTTTALRLGTMLEQAGKTVHTVSMDNYFIPIDDPRNEVDEDGHIDLESPKRLDIDLLNDHLNKMWKCEKIHIPTFDFALQQRFPGKDMKRNHGEFVIIEGIHALNPQITGNIGKHATTVYVSVRTRLKNEEGELLHPSKIRLMRRLVRDKLFRGREASKTLDFFKWVERGEKRFIMPYKESAMYDIDTFISYEPAVYKPFVLGELLAVKNTYPDYEEYSDLEEFLEEIDDLDRENVPLNSLVREFVGGSNYVY